MEFALTAPLLIGIVVVVVELGIMFSVYVGLTNSAREAARAAAIYHYTGATPFTNNTSLISTIDAERESFMSETLTSTLNPIILSDMLTVTVSYLPAPGASYSQPTNTAPRFNPINPLRAGDTVSVTLQHTHSLFWGLFGRHDLVIKATGASRIEPGGAN